ncbi:uncharacterized protein yc1106_02701 [Curvularia clavata]|uniref:Uncharacterized protein n=1 Tax=Curvularia clavata TaxID=95742 RepID=A0A9Q9DQB6_CURCL|nr:uncharacterized protein yc1106_02701 [Curvularia clavata]
MLFTFLEYSRGKYEIAETHLKNGIRLLGEGAPGIEKSIVRSFVALVTQRSLFGTQPDDEDDDVNNIDFVLLLNPRKDVLLPGAVFAGPEDAKYALDIILRRIARAEQLVQRTRTHRLLNPQQYHFNLEKEQAELSDLLSSWHSTYLRTLPKIRTSPTTPDSLAFGTHSAAPISRETLSYTLLLLHHTLSLIKVSALLSPSESIYRTQTPLFLHIVSHAAALYAAYRLAAAVPNNVNLHESVSESGFIAPLYYTGLKCRVGHVRRYACKYLREIPHKEGVWDSVLAANVVKSVMCLEEEQDKGGEECKLGGDETIDLSKVPVLKKGEEKPSALDVGKWFRSVRVEMLREEGTRARVVCERVRSDGGIELVEFMVDNK